MLFGCNWLRHYRAVRNSDDARNATSRFRLEANQDDGLSQSFALTNAGSNLIHSNEVERIAKWPQSGNALGQTPLAKPKPLGSSITTTVVVIGNADISPTRN